MLKPLSLVCMSLLLAQTAFAESRFLLKCEVEQVHNSSYLEESLSVEEYPEVTILQDENGVTEAHLGMTLYSEAKGDVIKPTYMQSTANYSIIPSHKLWHLSVVADVSWDNKGFIFVRERLDENQEFGEWVKLASMKCNFFR